MPTPKQGLMTIPPYKFIRKLGILQPAQMEQVETVAKKWLGFPLN